MLPWMSKLRETEGVYVIVHKDEQNEYISIDLKRKYQFMQSEITIGCYSHSPGPVELENSSLHCSLHCSEEVVCPSVRSMLPSQQ